MQNEELSTILITGGAGFIGSNFVKYLLEKYPQYFIVNLDALTYAGTIDNLNDVRDDQRHVFIKGNICDRPLVEEIFNKYDIKGVIHFAAESHVDNSIKSPDIFMRTNVLGTFTLLDVARDKWLRGPRQREGFQESRFHHISTDEVYGSLGSEGFFTEMTPYAPNSPYSASKAASDMVVRSYYHTYGLNTVITNCSNNYGPKQHAEKFVPTIIRKALAHEIIPIYGDGKNVRDWLYVMDHCRGIDLAYHMGRNGETYNIGARNEKDNLAMANVICEIMDKIIPKGNGSYKKLIQFVADRPGHDKRYAIDADKIEMELGWKAEEKFDTGIMKTVEWYIQKC